jgi:PAS domain S-box-containing protein
MDKVGRKILEHFNANRVTLSRIDIHHGTVTVTDSWQLTSAPPAPAVFNIDDFYDHWMVSELHRGRLVAIDDVGSDSRTAQAAKRFEELSIRSSLHSPYLAGGDQVFKLAIHKPRTHVWTPDEKDLCRELTASIFLRLERSAGNQRLRESEARLRMATETAEMFVWEADITANKMIWAENAPKILGCEPGDLPADLDSKWFFIHPDDRERVDREFRDAIAGGRRQFSVGFRGKDQGGESTFWVVQAFVIADPDGNAVRLVGTTQNVTRLRRSESRLQESEERLRLILDSVMDHAIVTQTAEGIVTGWNPGAVNTFGYQPDEIIGQPIDVLFTPEDRAAGVPQDEMNTARSVGRAEDERWHMRKDGSRFYASGVLSPLRGGPNTGFVKVARDLTAKQKAEEELRRAREELEVRVRERTRELNESNKALRQEVAERVKSEEARVGLLRRIVTTQEDERGRIARDLHDQLGQRLTALRL